LAAPRQLVWLLLRTPTQLNEADAATLARLQHRFDTNRLRTGQNGERIGVSDSHWVVGLEHLEQRATGGQRDVAKAALTRQPSTLTPVGRSTGVSGNPPLAALSRKASPGPSARNRAACWTSSRSHVRCMINVSVAALGSARAITALLSAKALSCDTPFDERATRCAP